jgi:hypothetical protein
LISAAGRVNKDIKSGVVSARTVVVALTFSALIIPAIIWALYSTGRFERLLMGTNDDNSAAARVVIYDIFNLIWIFLVCEGFCNYILDFGINK